MLEKSKSMSEVTIDTIKRLNMGAKNITRLYIGVSKAKKTGLNGGEPSTCCACALQFLYIKPGLVPIGFTDLRISFDILLELTRFLKRMSIRFLH